MLKMIIPAVLVLVASVVGGFGAQFLKGSPEAAVVEEETDAEGKEEDAEDESKDGEKKKKEEKKSGGDYGDGAEGFTYFKFSREFIIPIMNGGEVISLVILNISLEADARSGGTLFTQEPKIRDRIMTSLIAISNDGQTLVNLTKVENFETIRTVVLKDLQYMFPNEGISNVLILDVGKQAL